MPDLDSSLSPTTDIESLNETENSSSEGTARPPSTPPLDEAHTPGQDPDDAITSGPASLHDVDPLIVEALRGKDRLFVLKLGEAMESVVDEQMQRLELTPATSYQRLLVHRCSAYYKLATEMDPVSKNMYVRWTVKSRIPALRISDMIPTETDSTPAVKVMYRLAAKQRDKRPNPDRGPNKLPKSIASGRGKNTTGVSAKRDMTIEEREAAYNEARSRIFMDFEEKEKDKAKEDDSHSSSSYFTAQTSLSNSTGVSTKRDMTIGEREAAYNEARSRIFMDFEREDEAKDNNTQPSAPYPTGKPSGRNPNGARGSRGTRRPSRGSGVPRNAMTASPPLFQSLSLHERNPDSVSLSNPAQQSTPSVSGLYPYQKLWLDHLRDNQSPLDPRSQLPPVPVVPSPIENHPLVHPSSDRANVLKTLGEVWRLLAAVLSNKSAYKVLLGLKDDKARAVLDLLHKALDNPHIPIKLAHAALYATMRLCTTSGAYPQCLALQEIRYEAKPVASGAFGDIWKGYHRDHPVCLKVARVYQGSDVEHLIKVYMREAIMWSHLNHPNLLPFYGIYQVDERLGCVCLVSPWMQNGNINEYLKGYPEAPRLPLVHDILAGLGHLHKQSVVHGDLKGANILISNTGSACLADFGLSSIVDSEILRWTSLKTMTRVGGTVRWQAPELMDDSEDDPRPTFASDIYSVASVMYEVFTNQLPFYEVKSDMTVMSRVNKGLRPTRPSVDKALELSAEIWQVMERCWSSAPDKRPSVDQVAERLASIPVTELAIKRIEAQKLKAKQDVEPDMLTSLSFRAAMRGQDTGFSKAEIELLQEYAKGLPQSTLDPDIPVLRFGDHDTNIADTTTMQIKVESDPIARDIPSEIAVHIDDSGIPNGNRATLETLTQPVLPQDVSPRHSHPVLSIPYIPPYDLRIDTSGVPITYPTQPAWAQVPPPISSRTYSRANSNLSQGSHNGVQLHPILGVQNSLYFDLSSPEFKPLKHSFLRYFAYPSTEELSLPCSSPPITYAHIICDLVPQWPVTISSNSESNPMRYYHVVEPRPIEVGDILRVIYDHFRTSITQQEWAQLSQREEAEITSAYTSRCESSGPTNAEERNGGVRRIDYSRGNVWFKGLTQADDSLTFKLHLGP